MTHHVSKREPHKGKGLSRTERRWDDEPNQRQQQRQNVAQRASQPRAAVLKVEGNVYRVSY